MRDDRPEVLLVGGNDGPLEFVRAVGRFAARRLPSGAAALAAVAARPPALVIADFVLPDGDGVSLLARVAAVAPTTRRMLIASWDELPAVVRAGASPALALRVLPRGRWSHEFQRALVDAVESPVAVATPTPMPPIEERLATTMSALVRVPGVVIRPLPDGATRVPVVVPRDASFAALRCELPRSWGWPATNLAFSWRHRRHQHPALRALGRLEDGQEVYSAVEGALRLQLAVLPWRHRPLATLLFDFWAPADIGRHVLCARARALHRFAVEHAPAFFLYVPDVDAADLVAGAAYVDEYDWVVTPRFVGLDRRARATPLFGRFTLTGRRRHLPAHVHEPFRFIDRVTPRARRWVAVYLLFSFVDLMLTFFLVRAGTVREANPLLRALVLHHAALFVAVKNGGSLLALLVVMRFELSRVARLLLPLNALAYVALDGYWAWLLLRPGAGGAP